MLPALQRQPMRLVRTALLALGFVAAFSAWPQGPSPPAVDHSLHPITEVRDDRPIPSLRLRVSPDRMDGFNIFLETRNFLFTPGLAGSAPVANEGHAHLYVNGEKVARMYSPWHHLPAKLLRDGINRLEVEFSANDHSVWGVAGEPIGADVLIDTHDGDGDPILREGVRYTLDWHWGKARRSSRGGWEVRTDLGYLVWIEAGRLVTRNLELVPCHAVPPPENASLRRFGPVPAYAGHSSLMPNESKISRSYEEDLAEPRPRFLEERFVTDPEYCRAHYLIARPRRSPLGTAALELQGQWSDDSGAAEGTEFRIRSSAAYGQFVGLTSETGVGLARRTIVGGIGLTVLRRLETMFDGIDFANAGSGDLGAQIIRRLVEETQVVVGG